MGVTVKQASLCPKCGGPRTYRSNGSFGGKPRTKPHCRPCEQRRISITYIDNIRSGRQRWTKRNPEKRTAPKDGPSLRTASSGQFVGPSNEDDYGVDEYQSHGSPGAPERGGLIDDDDYIPFGG